MRYKTTKAQRERVQRYRDNNPELVKRWRSDYNKKVVRVDTAIQAVFKGRPCVDCGVVFCWDAMQFDHLGIYEDRKVPWMRTDTDFDMWVLQKFIGDRRGKTACVSHLTRHKLTPINLMNALKEIAACELVCANCHMCRTANRKRNK